MSTPAAARARRRMTATNFFFIIYVGKSTAPCSACHALGPALGVAGRPRVGEAS